MVLVSFIVQGQYVIFGEPKELPLKVENNRFDDLKANSAWKGGNRLSHLTRRLQRTEEALVVLCPLCQRSAPSTLQVYSEHGLPLVRTRSLRKTQLQQVSHFHRDGQEALQL